MLRSLRCCFKSADRGISSSKNHVLPSNEVVELPHGALDEKSGHIYMIREREFLKTAEPIYKIGKTTNIKSRMPSYPKNSRLYLCFFCSTNIDVVERHLIKLFDERFVKRTDIGAEYYQGDVIEMLRILVSYPITQPYGRS
jgi:hypothetical protein